MQIDNFIFNVDLETVLEELRKQLSINNIELLEKGFKQSGNSLQIQCPYHGNGKERKPSAGIRKSDGMFHCFACNEIHTLPEVISHCFGHEDMGVFGWQWLMKNFATVRKEERADVQIDFERNITSVKDTVLGSTNTNKYVTEEELDSYRYYHPYWTKRGITDEQLITLFDLGYDKKTQCITFPIRDKQGNCLFVARRSVRTKFFQYPKGVTKPLYGLYELYQLSEMPKEIIICESMLDALTCWQYGSYAVALNGLGNDLQFKQLRDLPCRELILATDNDIAGITARERIKKNVSNKLIREFEIPHIKRANGTVTKDINDLSKPEFMRLSKIF